MKTKFWMTGVCVALMGAVTAAQAQVNSSGGTFVGANGAGGGSGNSLDVGAGLGVGVNTGASTGSRGMNVGAGLNATTPATTTPGSNVNIRGDSQLRNGMNAVRGNAAGNVNTRPADMRGYGVGVMGNSRVDELGTGSIYSNTGVGADVRTGPAGVGVGAGAATQGRVNR